MPSTVPCRRSLISYHVSSLMFVIKQRYLGEFDDSSEIISVDSS